MMKAAPRGKKITLEIPDDLLKAAKLRMIEEDTNLRTVIITALEKHLGGKATKPRKERQHAR